MKMKKTIAIVLMIVLCVLLCGCSINQYTYENARRYTAGEGTVNGRVKKIEIGWVDGSITIDHHNEDSIRLSESSTKHLSEKNQLHWWLDGNTLRVHYAASGINLDQIKDKHLTVLLPKGTVPDRLTINSVSAHVKAENIAADVLECNSVSGDAQLSLNHMPKKININSVSGNVRIAMPEDAGYTLELTSVSGTVNNTLQARRLGNTYIGGNGECAITMNTVSGDVYLSGMQ